MMRSPASWVRTLPQCVRAPKPNWTGVVRRKRSSTRTERASLLTKGGTTKVAFASSACLAGVCGSTMAMMKMGSVKTSDPTNWRFHVRASSLAALRLWPAPPAEACCCSAP